MNIKKSLSILIIFSMLFVGCSNYHISENSITLPDEATKQKTMTKVQNNLNEIKDKDYEYVLSNLGEPNVTSYWINKEDISNLSNIEKVNNMNLVYLKDVSNEETNSSALYLQLEDNIVKKAQIIDYSSLEVNKNFIKSDILLSTYDKETIINMEDFNDNLEDLIGYDVKEITSIANEKPSCNIYIFDDVEKCINLYKTNEDKILAVVIDNEKICDIKLLSDIDDITDIIK